MIVEPVSALETVGVPEDAIGKAAIMAVDRHRIESDGDGITTLVGFYGCPLKCRYCLNEQCHAEPENIMTPEDLFNRVKIDDIYFRSSRGGVTFGGSEPLLHPRFISTFAQLCERKWAINLETSLNVPLDNLRACAEDISCFMVDLKCIDNSRYAAYTGKSNNLVLENLEWLSKNVEPSRIIVRVPTILGVTNESDISSGVDYVNSLGISNVDMFEYILPADIEWAHEARINQGKNICSTLKDLRQKIARANGLQYKPVKCNYDGPCRGTCPRCDAELDTITQYINILERYNHLIVI